MIQIDPKVLVDRLVEDVHIEEFCGVSDSTLKYLINEVSNRGMYTPFTNEGDAVAYAAGRTVAGHPTAVLMQNSGLTNASSPISSLVELYHIPMIFIVGWRGYQEGGSPFKDEPQHEIVGKNTYQFIDSMTDSRVFWDLTLLPDQSRLHFNFDHHCSYFVMVRPGMLTPVKLNEEVYTPYTLPRTLCIYNLLNLIKDKEVSIVSTTGHTSRELMTYGEENPKNFYMFGSMGCATPFAYGLAKSRPDRKFIILDGDGAFLMRPESKAVCSDMNLDNVLHIIFKNGSHLSTGNQTLPCMNDFVNIVLGCSSSDEVKVIDDITDFIWAVNRWLKSPSNQEPSTLIVNVSSEIVPDLPRPKSTPEEILERFVKELGDPDGSSSK